MRMLMYSQDGMGLGHLRRTRNIAQEVLAMEPDCGILIVSDSSATPFFPPLRGVDYLKLPTIVKTGSADWRTGTLPLSVDDTVNLRARVIREVFREFGPDVVVVDHGPVGALGELKPLLDDAGSSRLFLNLRDVLDEPEVIRRVWNDLDAYRYLAYYDAVLVYGCRDVFDAESAYALIPSARDVVFCNYAAPRRPIEPPENRLQDQFVLVMGGGGGDAYPLAKAFLDALPITLRSAQFDSLILTGPNMPVERREELQAQATTLPVRIEVSVEDATALLERASAVVTMGGYNSLSEVLQWRKKALVVPRAGPSAEQRIRSRLFSERGLVRALEPEALTPERLAQELLRLLTEDGTPDWGNTPPLDGARRAAAVLLEGLGSRPMEMATV